ncbi:hypothetical protein KFL_003060040 [Klebsormidium nitens]|uniref:Transmembrane protein n=1 Tax=Klebsormidium nitens TaxID=105231 RepID=A0A1Y1I6X5_KLENI|nr:hypothetical protein KFL_003060040 [Klebsormidium nitens]|eukprot:GAQ86705.1 hypothetical protein KFL_003060040 [Klebsormidium nitens]
MASTNRIAPTFVLGSKLDPAERQTDARPPPVPPPTLMQSLPYGLAPITSKLKRLGTRTALSISQSWRKGPPANIIRPGAAEDEPLGVTNTAIASSIFFQMLLYFNVQYSIVWFPAMLTSRFLKPKFGVVEAALLVLFLVSEPVRLALGYSGNLQEKVPFVAAFMLLTLFPGLPVCLYFMFVQKHLEPSDKAVGTLMAIFLVLELFTAVHAIRQLIRSQTLKFYLEDYEDVREQLRKGLTLDT